MGECKDFLTGTNFLVYCSHFLSAWGDRMWAFGVGLFLIKISPDSLQLTASYGLASGLSILLLGALIGDWVDNTPRLKAAQLSLVLQNLCVALCAGVVYVNLTYQEDIESMWDGWLQRLASAVIIILAILANVFSLARVIAVEKDWIVEICGKDKDMLARMTSTLRRIDLATKILAPIATGQIMYFTEMRIGAVFIGGWNVVTVFLEYYLIWKVYNTVPALSKKKYWTKNDRAKAESPEEEIAVANEANPDLPIDDIDGQTQSRGDNSNLEIPDAADEDQQTISSEKIETAESSKETEDVPEEDKEEHLSCCGSILKKMFSSFVILYKGWRTYLTYDVANAGLGLACLYMTVLGFDNITTGYAYSQGISESILGGFMGGAALIGIIGTLAYPALRRCVGLERTGLFALSAQITCLMMCVLSVWLPGSPFNPYYFFEDHSPSNETTCPTAASLNSSYTTASPLVVSFNSSYTTATVAGVKNPGVAAVAMVVNNTTPAVPGCEGPTGPESYISIALLMAGIITARFGLWVADLTITQLFLERVKEHERGKVNGVQNSINKLMDVLKFILVVALPQPPVFGFLVIVSFAFICLGFGLYASYSRRSRGHLLPFHKHCLTTEEANNAVAA
ncbi:solute carrier family 40 member 1-like isoform X2 [Haliotis rufescens]|uniref:solute carrier family 40 member 1-like isoform X2 n=1 Tax=Haliotis rufescens TaxID=6454 RepID=UPI00201F398E|nr:solute carrier family 40 member 1-like isoform X2 [Haliotis rufescens]